MQAADGRWTSPQPVPGKWVGAVKDGTLLLLRCHPGTLTSKPRLVTSEAEAEH